MGDQPSPVLTFQPLPELLLCRVPQYPEHVEEAQGGAGGHQQIRLQFTYHAANRQGKATVALSDTIPITAPVV